MMAANCKILQQAFKGSKVTHCIYHFCHQIQCSSLDVMNVRIDLQCKGHLWFKELMKYQSKNTNTLKASKFILNKIQMLFGDIKYIA
jgi:hypothetical protein